MWSKVLTAVWGMLAIVLAFWVDDIASTVLVAVNKLGSLINGPLLAVFVMGLLTQSVTGRGARVGFAAGFISNLLLWLGAPEVSWLWWNVVGFFVTFVIGWGLSLVATTSSNLQPEYLQNLRMANIFTGGYLTAEANIDWSRRCVFMLAWFLTLLILLWMLGG